MKASDLFIKALENEGVEYIFALPGEENLDVLESIRKSKIKLIITRHEQGAGFMAATYGRFTGKAGVCMTTLGPGATNLVTAVAYAQLGAMPMFVITGQKPIKKSKQGKFQILDVVEMMKPLTKFAKQITHSESIPSLVREGFRIAQEERSGAVHLELPEDIAQEEVSNHEVFEVVDFLTPQPAQKSIDQAVKMIQESQKPLLLIGAGANRKNASKSLEQFLAQTGIPFFNTQMGKGVLDERHHLYLGTAALSDGDFLHEAINQSDLIVNVGHDTIEKPPFFMNKEDKRRVIHINFFPAHVDDVYFPQLNVIGDISKSIDMIGEKISHVDYKWNIESMLAVQKNVQSHLSKYIEDNRYPILPQRLVNIIRAQLPDDGIVTLDNGMYKVWFARNYLAYKPNTLLLDNALATMGAGLPSAIMAKVLTPDKKVISVSGDGGFMMNSQELETAKRLNLDLVVIVLNDNGYGMIKWKQQGMNLERFGLDYTNPNFSKYAESFGITPHCPTSVKDFEQMLDRALSSEGIHLIDVSVDYSLNHKILNILLKEYTSTIKNKKI